MTVDHEIGITEVIEALAKAPGLVASRSTVWFEEKDDRTSWWMEMFFPAGPFVFLIKRRLEDFFERASRYAFGHGYHCYFRYFRMTDLDRSDDEIAVRVHIVTFRDPALTDLKIGKPQSPQAAASKRTLFPLDLVRFGTSGQARPLQTQAVPLPETPA